MISKILRKFGNFSFWRSFGGSFFLCLFFAQFAFSQTLTGRITDTNGQPIMAASVFVHETRQGVISDADGNFQINLSPGTYRLDCSFMGFSPQTKTVEIRENETIFVQFTLAERAFSLPEVTATSGEDPANEIMRQAIARAPFFQHIVKSAVYETYTRGTAKFTGSSALLNRASGGQMDFFRDQAFVQESVSRIEFTAPDQYDQTVLAFSSTIPNDFNPQSALTMGMFSLYNPMLGNVVSPLNPNAFSHYRFRYEGFLEENGQVINRIRVTPRLRDARFLEGVLYIAENEWSIRHAEYTINQPFTTATYVINYSPVIDGIFLPTNYQADLEMNVLGITITMNFLSSIQFIDIQLNDSLIQVENFQPTSERRRLLPQRRDLEIRTEDRFRRTVDSLALERDSVFWSEVRTVALTDDEIRSFIRRDTVQARVDSLNQASTNPPFRPMHLVTGGRIGSDSAFVRFRYGGLSDLLREYNFVDGLWLGQSFTFDFKGRKNSGWIVSPSVFWTSARQSLVWQTDVSFDYAPLRLGRLEMSAGRTSEDFSGNAGLSRMLNSYYSVYYGINHARFYEKTFASISNRIDISNGLQLRVEAEFADRRMLENHTTWSIFGRDRWQPNVPNFDQPLNENYSRLARGGIRLQYTPELFYRIRDGRKHYVRSRFPTFALAYQQGINGFSGDDYSTFSRLEFSVNQRVSLGLFDNFSYRFVAGRFLNTNPFNYIDYKHFHTGGVWLSLADKRNSYALLPFYAFSTNTSWIQAFATYQSDYLLLKRLPFLQGRMFSENLHANFLHTPEKPFYSEFGYSVNFLGNLISAGVFVSFDSFQYNSVGFQLSMPLLGGNRGQREIVVGF